VYDYDVAAAPFSLKCMDDECRANAGEEIWQEYKVNIFSSLYIHESKTKMDDNLTGQH
jgi:hypothetical protein